VNVLPISGQLRVGVDHRLIDKHPFRALTLLAKEIVQTLFLYRDSHNHSSKSAAAIYYPMFSASGLP